MMQGLTACFISHRCAARTGSRAYEFRDDEVSELVLAIYIERATKI